ncbi:luciferase family oxidoreductase group 1 [Evansella vedderi]|uniref:Luciferase family oxidoreductase group 1 n=1 Tax=Evansella vedderi TaxID=38282 RepID=A0ABT9ZWU9_9BACI|nr:LLM class flavin-dependent oxidoreductase [Evansella vedderi]MDQ0255707.1 luciferase family oxidoreductase group 1 [Evansella vedderi]
MSDKIELTKIPYSVLDLAPITQGGTAAESFQHTFDLAQHAESLGYHRFWLAEHHNMPGIASSATAVLIGQVAARTSTIRVGSGGIMLPNHSPLIIAEQFGTLESLFPNRIDLGLGRAPGTDQITMRAIRRDPHLTGDDFPEQLAELRGYFDATMKKQVRAFPGEGLDIPIWLLGSSGFSARLSAQLGLPFAFASHFSPENTLPALQLYYDYFQPSELLDEPYAMVGLNIIAADTDEEAKRLSTSMQQQFLNMIRNQPTQLLPPVDDMDDLCTPYEKSILEKQLGGSIIGSPINVKEQLEVFLTKTQAKEIMINGQIYDHQARLRSFEIISDIMKEK